MFKDRNDGGEQLALLLQEYKNSDAIIFALPRGGVVIGYEIAKLLDLPLELIITRKIGHPDYPEYAIGAVSETGKYIINKNEFVDEKWLKEEIKNKQNEAVRRKKVYCGGREEVNIKDKTAIIVDDGVATGLSLSLAIQEIRAKEPMKIVVAVPVISQDVAYSISKISDKLVAIEVIEGDFGSVGNYYLSFPQVSDREVIKILSKIWEKRQS
ncbi:MAG: phosphoribosyltransferase family protein [Minisyncoccia bacterium]